jgi:threonine dehydrogenase-like Zn-dependent dehydrogenase
MRNPSIVLYGAKNARVEDRIVPELIEPHDVIIRIKYVGVCGSDICHFPVTCSRPFYATYLDVQTADQKV